MIKRIRKRKALLKIMLRLYIQKVFSMGEMREDENVFVKGRTIPISFINMLVRTALARYCLVFVHAILMLNSVPLYPKMGREL